MSPRLRNSTPGQGARPTRGPGRAHTQHHTPARTMAQNTTPPRQTATPDDEQAAKNKSNPRSPHSATAAIQMDVCAPGRVPNPCRLRNSRTPKTAKRERYMTPRIGASGAAWSSARAPGLDRPGVNPVPGTGASEATERIRQKDAPDWSLRGGMKHGTSPRTGSSGGEPGATDWSVRGNGENTIKRRPRLEHPGRNEARH